LHQLDPTTAYVATNVRPHNPGDRTINVSVGCIRDGCPSDENPSRYDDGAGQCESCPTVRN
jgi:hypothetical protein